MAISTSHTAGLEPSPVSLSERWRDEAIAVLVIAAVALVHTAILLLRHRTYFAAPDNTTQFWAWYQKASSVLHSGSIPLWDENTLAGHSFVGETQTGVFYPLNLIWLLILGSAHGIGTRALDMLVVFHLFVGSVGMYALARSFRVQRPAAVIVGIVFAYTGTVFSRATGQTAIFFGLTLVPWAVFFAHRQLETRRLRFAVGTGGAIGLAVLAGHFEPPFHACLLVVLFYALTRPVAAGNWRKEVRPRLLGLIVSFGVAAAVAAPQLAYSLPYLSRAFRFIGPGPPVPPGGSVSFGTFSTLYTGAPDSILSMLDPQRYTVPDANTLFIGISALVVLVTGLLFAFDAIRTQLGRYGIAVTAALLVGALAMLGSWTPFAAVLYVLPFVTEVRELARYSIMVHLSICLLLALAIDAILAARPAPGGASRWPRASALGVFGLFVSVNGIYLISRHAPGSDSWFGIQLLLGGLMLLTLAAWGKLGRISRIALLGGLLVASSLHNGLMTLGSTRSPFYPSHYYATTGAIMYAEHACRDHRSLVLGDALPVNVGDVFRQLRTENGYGATMQVSYYDFITSSSPTSREQTMLLDLRCIVSPSAISVPGYHLAYRDSSGVLVYVNDDTSGLITASLQPIPSLPIVLEDRKLLYAFVLHRTEKVIMSANIYPGWKLVLDGHQVRSGAFRGDGVPVFPEITVPPGRHTLQYSWSGSPF